MNRMETGYGAVRIVAQKEFLDCVRGRWLLIGAVLFAILSLAIVFGSAAIGGDLTFRPLNVVMNSLIGLVTFLIPLIAFLISYEAFVGEAEGGTLLLMLTYPISRSAWLLGKLAGQGTALLAALVAGFLPFYALCAAGVLPYAAAEVTKLLLLLIASGWLLGLIAILTAYTVSLYAASKVRALGVLLLIWLLTVLLYDLGLLVLAVAGQDWVAKEWMLFLMAVNPASAFRLINQTAIGVQSVPVPSALLLALMGAWLAGLLAADMRKLARITL